MSQAFSVAPSDAAAVAALRYAANGSIRRPSDVMHPVRNAVLAKGGLIRLRDREQRLRSQIRQVETAIETG
jgi:hypothetical protein